VWPSRQRVAHHFAARCLLRRPLTGGEEFRAPARFWFPFVGAVRDRCHCLYADFTTRQSVSTPPSLSPDPSSSLSRSIQFPNCSPNHLREMSGDPRLTVGSTVHTKAKNIRSAITCTRLLGTRANDAVATGTVTQVTRAKVDGRMSTSIMGLFECLDKTVDKTLRVRSIRPGPAPSPIPPLPPPSSQMALSVSSQPPPHATLPDATGARLELVRLAADATAPGSVSGAGHAMVLHVGTQATANRGPNLLLQGAAFLAAPRALPAGSSVTPPSPNHLALGSGSAADPPPPVITLVKGPNRIAICGSPWLRAAGSGRDPTDRWTGVPSVVVGAYPGTCFHQKRGGRGWFRPNLSSYRLLPCRVPAAAAFAHCRADVGADGGPTSATDIGG